jgi:nitroreductase
MQTRFNKRYIIFKEADIMTSPVLEAIYRRRSIREFIDKEISREQLHEIVKAGIWALIAVYLSKEDMYDTVKDIQAAGACIQNILLAAEALELGAVWLGQILKNKLEVNKILGLADNFDLMAVVALGHPSHRNQKSRRKEISELLLKEL